MSFALQHGYRHIDTARDYENEASVGRAVRENGLDRDEIFVTSKLSPKIKTYRGALESFGQTAADLGLEHLDLYLIYAP